LHGLRCCFDSVNDLLVPGASAEVPRKPFTDLSSGRAGVSFQEIERSQNSSWSAETALYCALFNKGFLQGVQPVLRSQPLHGGDFSALKLGCQHKAGELAFPIDKNGARAALACGTRFLRGCEPQVFPEQIDDSSIGRAINPHG
jgi:hypothetical protein